jgi:hypothetical protein
LWCIAKAKYGPTADPATIEVRPFLRLLGRPAVLKAGITTLATGSTSQRCMLWERLLGFTEVLLVSSSILSQEERWEGIHNLQPLRETCGERVEREYGISGDAPATPPLPTEAAIAAPGTPTAAEATIGSARSVEATAVAELHSNGLQDPLNTRADDTAADAFEAQSTLLAMCAAEQLLTREELTKLHKILQQLQAAAVMLGSTAGDG